jgi:hypothetical protein
MAFPFITQDNYTYCVFLYTKPSILTIKTRLGCSQKKAGLGGPAYTLCLDMKIRNQLLLASFALISLVLVALAVVTIALAALVLVAMPRFTLWSCLLNGGVIIIHDNNRVAPFALLVLGMARVGSMWMVRVVRIFGPSFLVVFVMPGFAVFNNYNWPSGRAFFVAGDMARRQSGHR